MASPVHFFLRILKTVAYNLWTILLFLFVLSILALVNHFWEQLVQACILCQNAIQNGLDFLRAL